MSKSYKDIGNERYYGCATRSEAAELGGKGQGDNSLCTVENVLGGDYGVTFVDHTMVSYEDHQAVAYVDLKKDTSTVEQEVNLELASVTCGVAMAQEEYETQTVSEHHKAYGSGTGDWSGWKGNSFIIYTVSDEISQGATIDYSAIIYKWVDPVHTEINSSYFDITPAYSYSTLGSDNTWGGYLPLTDDFTTTTDTKIQVQLTFTPLKDYNTDIANQNHQIEVNIEVPYTKQVTKLIYKEDDYIPCKPSVSTVSLLSPGQPDHWTDIIQPKSVSRKANIVDLVLQGPTKADYTYRSGTDLDNKQLGLIIPIQFSFNNVATDAIELHAFGIDSILSENWEDGQAYKTYNGDNVRSWFQKTTWGVIGSGCGGGDDKNTYPLCWNFYKMPDYADGYEDRIYEINDMFGNFSSVQNGFVLELKWNPYNHILPEGSVQIETQLCSMRCELDITSKETGKKYRTTVIFNIWLNPFNAVTSPPPQKVEPDYLYVRVKKTNLDSVFPILTEEQQNRCIVTFGEVKDHIWKYDSECEDGSQWYYTEELFENEWQGKKFWQLGGKGIFLSTIGGYHFETTHGTNSIFTGRDDILEVIFPNRLNVIGALCFANCKNLEKVTFKGGQYKIEANAFIGCNSLTIVDLSPIVNKKLTIESRAFKGNTNMQELIFSPSAVIEIDNSAFEDNTSMKMTIAGGQGFNEGCGFSYIGDYVFNCCYNLGETLHLGFCNNVGLYAFENCSTIKNIYVEWDNKGFTELYGRSTVKTGAFKGCTNVQAIYSKELPARMHCCNIWYRKAINPQTATLYVEDKEYSGESYYKIYSRHAQWGDFNTHGNLKVMDSST